MAQRTRADYVARPPRSRPGVGAGLVAIVVASGFGSAALFAAIGLMITYDVISRVVFQSPTNWTLETATYVMVAAVFLGGPYALHRSEHIAVDLLTHLLPRNAARVLLRGTLVVTALLFALIAVQSTQMALHAARSGLVSPTIHLPAWLFQATLPIGTALMALEAVRQLLASLRERTLGP